MTKSLLQQVMVKQTKIESHIDTKSLVEAIEKGYLVGRDTKFVQKKKWNPTELKLYQRVFFNTWIINSSQTDAYFIMYTNVLVLDDVAVSDMYVPPYCQTPVIRGFISHININ